MILNIFTIEVKTGLLIEKDESAWGQCYKTFLFVIYELFYKLECLSLASLSSLV
jgi:hypothetical protein